MYKFLVNMPQPDVNSSDWFYSYNSRMYPNFSANVKEAILVGYHSQKQDKWITSGTSIHLVEDYKKVRKAFPDSEMCLIVLSFDLKERSESPYFRFYPNTAEEFV